jgi:hypothetical protein
MDPANVCRTIGKRDNEWMTLTQDAAPVKTEDFFDLYPIVTQSLRLQMGSDLPDFVISP